MIEKTYYSNGKNEFKDNTFSAQEWSAPIMTSPSEIKELLASFKLEGRIIKGMKFVGLAYNLKREWIEEHAYSYLKNVKEEERQQKSNYNNIDPSTKYGRFAEIDEPFLIEFEDEDRFEIDTPQEPEVCMSMNCIPWWIDSRTNLRNAEANILFRSCIGKKIVSTEVKTYIANEDPMFHQPFDEEKSERELVSAIILWLDDGTGLRIEGWIDFCHVSLVGVDGNEIDIPFEELRTALFNWEDLHIDPLTGYEANSSQFYFGITGAKHTDEPYMKLNPGGKETCLTISVDDFLLFDWSITNYTEKSFDEYGEYEFSFRQWWDILAEAGKLLSFHTFDELFEYMTSISITIHPIFPELYSTSVTLNNLNCRGAEFWKNREKYRAQLDDMQAWTTLTLSDTDTMTIYGF